MILQRDQRIHSTDFLRSVAGRQVLQFSATEKSSREIAQMEGVLDMFVPLDNSMNAGLLFIPRRCSHRDASSISGENAQGCVAVRRWRSMSVVDISRPLFKSEHTELNIVLSSRSRWSSHSLDTREDRAGAHS